MPSAISPSLYGLHQAPHQWFLHFITYVTSLGFIQSCTDTSLFVLCHGTEATYLLLYVDNMILYASSSKLLQQIITKLRLKFTIKDMGSLQSWADGPMWLGMA
jgi:hypothetical protein